MQASSAAGLGVVVGSEHVGRARVHRAVPGLVARLVVSLGTPLEVRYDGRVERLQAVVAGLMRPGKATPSLVLRERQPTVYVELSPAAMLRLTGTPLRDVDAGGVDAEALLPWIGWFADELAAQPAERRARVARVRLLERLGPADRVSMSGDVLGALKAIEASRGQIPVEDVARYAHLSPRHLRHVMRRELGVGPKFAARVARLNTAVGLAGGGAGSWARVAAESGYHDQSHLVRDFNELMATTPSGWLAEESRNLQGRPTPSP